MWLPPAAVGLATPWHGPGCWGSGGPGHSPAPVQAGAGWLLGCGSYVWRKDMRSEIWRTLSASFALGLGFTHDECKGVG